MENFELRKAIQWKVGIELGIIAKLMYIYPRYSDKKSCLFAASLIDWNQISLSMHTTLIIDSYNGYSVYRNIKKGYDT